MAMALPEGLNRRYASIAAILLASVWLWVAFDRPYSFPQHVPWNTYANAPQTPDTITAGKFDERVLTSQAIQNMCASTRWNSKLVFQCDNAAGDLGNVRHNILSCVRYAITAGATLLLPRIINPDGFHEAGTTLLDWNRQPFDFMFDTQYFLESMASSCPEMHVYAKKEDIPFPNNYVRPPRVTIFPESIGLLPGENWRDAFYQIVEAMVSPAEDTFPIIIEMAAPAPVYNVYDDGEEFARDFGKLLKLRPEVGALAKTVIQKLAEVSNSTFEFDQQIIPESFIGVHLYTEVPQIGAEQGWPAVDWDYARYEPQKNNILSAASTINSTLIYLASERQDEIALFTKDASEQGYSVWSKFSLLEGDDREFLDQLTKEQKDLVDYLVLLEGSYFVGVGHSSVSWAVALKRRTWVQKGGQFVVGSHIFEDELSHIYGKMDEGSTLYDTMWP